VNLSFALFDANSYGIYVLIGAGSVVIAALLVFFMVLSLKRRINPLRRAVKQYDRGRFEKGMLLIAIELDKNPDNRVALLLRADTEVSLGRYE
jgi:HAMP domain-containing protein